MKSTVVQAVLGVAVSIWFSRGHAQRTYTNSFGDTTLSALSLNDTVLESIFLEADFREHVPLLSHQDSISFQFKIMEVHKMSSTRYRLRVVHAQTNTRNASFVQDPFVAIYELKVRKVRGVLKLVKINLVLTEI